MNDLSGLNIIGLIIVILLGAYILGRVLTKAGLHEFDSYLNKKFNKFKKEKENGKKEK